MYRMFYPTLTLVLMTALIACANFQQKAGSTLATTQAAAISARETLLPVVDAMCRDLAETCRDDGDLQCDPLVQCHGIRDGIVRVLVGLHFAILDANTAIALGMEDDAWSAIDKALELVSELRKQLKELGIGT